MPDVQNKHARRILAFGSNLDERLNNPRIVGKEEKENMATANINNETVDGKSLRYRCINPSHTAFGVLRILCEACMPVDESLR